MVSYKCLLSSDYLHSVIAFTGSIAYTLIRLEYFTFSKSLKASGKCTYTYTYTAYIVLYWGTFSVYVKIILRYTCYL